jgi:hypothetical protein
MHLEKTNVTHRQNGYITVRIGVVLFHSDLPGVGMDAK